jgi:hypothetical protein
MRIRCYKQYLQAIRFGFGTTYCSRFNTAAPSKPGKAWVSSACIASCRLPTPSPLRVCPAGATHHCTFKGALRQAAHRPSHRTTGALVCLPPPPSAMRCTPSTPMSRTKGVVNCLDCVACVNDSLGCLCCTSGPQGGNCSSSRE